jgi:O-antigen/teichoic acid export membrane protein
MTFRESSLEMGSSVVWIAIAAALTQGATLLAGILVANAIGTHGFGTYSFLQSTLTNWSQPAALSSGLLATRYLAAYGRTNTKIAGEVIGYCTAMTAVAGSLAAIVLLLSRGYLVRNVDDAGPLGLGLLSVALVLPLSSLTLFQTGALVGLEKYRTQAWLAVLQSIAFVVAPFVGAKIHGAIGATLGLAAAIIVRFVSQRIALMRAMTTLRIRSTYSNIAGMIRLFLRFALPASLTGVTAGASLWLATLILVAQDTGPRHMGLYGAAQYFRLLVLFVPIQLTTIGVPLLTRHLTLGAHAKYAALLRTGVILTGATALFISAVLALVAPQVLQLFGSGFVAATELARLLLIGAVVEAIAGALYQVLPSREQMWRSFLLVALPRDCTFLIASWLLIPNLLSLGLGYALLISQCIGFLGVVTARALKQQPAIERNDKTDLDASNDAA